MNKNVFVHNLGLLDYQKAVEYQTNLFNNIIDQKLKNRKSNIKSQT